MQRRQQVRPAMAWVGPPAGVAEQGRRIRGFPRNLGDPVVSMEKRRAGAG